MEPFNWSDLWTRILPEWLTAVGTVGAVIVSLWLARRDKLVRLRVTAGIRWFGIKDVAEVGPEYLVISIVNVGLRNATVTSIGWQIGGLWFKVYAIQTFDARIAGIEGATLPKALGDGEVTVYRVRLDRWLSIYSWMLHRKGIPGRWLRSRLVYVTVQTSAGQTFRRRVEPGLAEAIYRFQPVTDPAAAGLE